MEVTYKATVTHGDRYWIVDVEGVGVTQARHLGELAKMTSDLIAVLTDVDPTGIDVEFDIQLPEEVRDHLERAGTLRETATLANKEAADEVRRAARQLHDSGVPLRDIGRALGVSHQRAHQLVH